MSKSAQALREIAGKADFWSLFILHEQHEELGFRKGIEGPIYSSTDVGALITVFKDGGLGYASTQDLSFSGIKRAYEQALYWASKFACFSLLKDIKNPFTNNRGEYQSPNKNLVSNILLEE